MKEDMSLSNLGTVAFHAAKVPTNVFSSTLICLLTLDYEEKKSINLKYIYRNSFQLPKIMEYKFGVWTQIRPDKMSDLIWIILFDTVLVFFEKVDFEKINRQQKSMKNYPVRKELTKNIF